MTSKPNAKTILLALLLPCAVVAGDWRDGEAKFSTKNLRVKRLAVTWQVVQNVQAACEAESRLRGLGGFGYGVDACSFWDASSSTIVTSSMPTMHQLGHEFRHCYQGSFH